MNDLFAAQTEPQIDETRDYLTDLVGDGKKFKTTQDLAKGKAHSDAYIEIQNRRMDQLRQDYLQLKADYDARAKLEELLDKLPVQQSQARHEQPPVEVENKAPAFDLNQLDDLVSKRLTQARSDEKAQDNYQQVVDRLKGQYADRWQNVLKERTDELGLTPDEVNAMARRSPKLFFRSMGLEQQPNTENFQTPPRSDQRFTPKGAQKRTWSYYQELKNKDRKAYLDPKMQTQMARDAVELGEEFNDGDFYAM